MIYIPFSIIIKNIKKEQTLVCSFLVAGLGFEPRQTESESVVLPLHNPASTENIISL